MRSPIVSHKQKQPVSIKLWLAGGAALLLELVLLCCCFRVHASSQEWPLNVSLWVLANAFGWFFGTLISPYTKVEKDEFSAYAKTASAFISGYFLSKIDKALTGMVSPEALSSTEAQFRLILFFAGVATATLVTFISRRYMPDR